MAWALSGRSLVLALTRITSSGVSLNTRLKASGSTKRTASSAACASTDTPSAICRVLKSRRFIGRWCLRRAVGAGLAVRRGRPRWRSGRRLLPRPRRLRLRPRVGRRGVEPLDDGAVHVERDLVDLAQRARAPARRAPGPGCRRPEHQRQRVGAHQRAVGQVLDQGGFELGDALLLQVLERPEALHAALVRVVGAVGGVEAGEDGEQVGVLGLEGRGQRGGLAVARRRDDLPLVHQVGVAAQRRGAPGVALDAQAGMRQRLGAHAHLDAGRQAGLAAVEAGHAQLAQPAAPAAVGQDHGFGDDQVERRAAPAGA